MKLLGRVAQIYLLLLFMNTVLQIRVKGVGYPSQIILTVVLAVFYVVCLFLPGKRQPELPRRLSIMNGGRTLIVQAAVCGTAEVVLYLVLFGILKLDIGWKTALINGIAAFCLISFMMFVGFVRIIVTSTQLGLVLRLLLIFTWWIPVWNIVLFVKACGVVKSEYYFELSRTELNEARRENEVCHTKYPILLVHGIFFRDWQFLNYWGRIPKELIRNGAAVYYGKQQSAAPVAVSAAELSRRIGEVLEEAQCDKVNIIAHSKGGLDSRYAISLLGMSSHVASLTTVNTPHRGCVFAERLLKLLPKGLVHMVSEKYNAVFRKLGDEHPDFLGGVMDLTAGRCREFNEQVKNSEAVYYQSVMSKMRGMLSAGFPLFASYPIVRFVEGENDGLVTPDSAKWGNYLGLITGAGRRGVSHGDMVDLMRENIPGFNVMEFYVDIVKGLKEKGF